MLSKHLMELIIFQKNTSASGMPHWQSWQLETRRLLRWICLGGTCAALVGCALFPFQTKPAQPVVPSANPPVPLVAPTALTEQAALILMRAEHSVIEARKTYSLWTTAAAKLAMARQAASSFDSDNTIIYSQQAIALCERSAAQAKLPPVSW